MKKVSSAFLLAIGIYANDDRYDSLFLSNYSTINLVDKVGSIPGVGDARLAATQDYGMRVWINPDKMAKLGLTATDVNRAIQDTEPAESGGRTGPAARAAGTDFSIRSSAAGRLLEPEAVRQHHFERRARRVVPAAARYRPRGSRRAGLQIVQPHRQEAGRY